MRKKPSPKINEKISPAIRPAAFFVTKDIAKLPAPEPSAEVVAASTRTSATRIVNEVHHAFKIYSPGALRLLIVSSHLLRGRGPALPDPTAHSPAYTTAAKISDAQRATQTNTTSHAAADSANAGAAEHAYNPSQTDGYSIPSSEAGDSPTSPVPSVVPKGPFAEVTLPTGETAVTQSHAGIFQCVGIPANQKMDVTVHFPTGQKTGTVNVEAIDGGLVNISPPFALSGAVGPLPVGARPLPQGVISATGLFTFTFQPGTGPGRYQVRLQTAGKVLGLQFWVLDPRNPSHNPPVIEPAYPPVVDPPAPPPV
jgi:hypothetical protein